jgi:flagellar biosynthesis protein FlhF
MRLKTFTAPTMPQAMKMVRTALGEHAVIMSTQQNKSGVIITAGIDEDVLDRAKAAASVAAPLPAAPESAVDVLDALSDVLDQHGCTRRLSQKLLRLVEDENTSDPTAILAQVLGTHYRFSDFANAGHPKPCVLVGPPGAGKTVAIAKLATQAVLQGRRAVVITADTIKAGGVEQLSALTRILQVPLHTVEDSHALHAAIHHAPEDAAIFIDTPGINPFSDQDVRELRALLGTESLLKVLALPGGSDVIEAAEIAGRFADGLKVDVLLPTRLDHARRLGGLLTAADAGGLSFATAALSASAAEALHPLSPAILARLVMTPFAQPKINAFAGE